MNIFSHRILLIISTSLCLALALATGYAVAGPYDALPLRSPQSSEPHFQTDLGRETHRFADGKINQYRLYDFYKRQAEYNLAQEKPLDLLLPYPGLEGGRRGHWGNTNEPLSSAVLERVNEPGYHRMLNRGDKGGQYVCVDHKNSQSVCFFPGSSTVMSTVTLNATLNAPVHNFSYKVDRFGLGMKLNGVTYLTGGKAEWHTKKGKPIKVVNDGYYLNGDRVIFRRELNGVPILDMPTVSYSGETAIYTRVFEFRDDVADLKFQLPRSTGKFGDLKYFSDKHAGANWSISLSDNLNKISHNIVSSVKTAATITHEESSYNAWISFGSIKKGTVITMSTSVSLADQKTTFSNANPAPLSSLIKGGDRYFKEEIVVKGILNADPAASGSAYEIDDIPVPSKNPYGIPMTTSGLTFSQEGHAYVSTLVGDIWKVTGLDGNLEKVKWQRYATGLNVPLGLEIVDGVLHVMTKTGILLLEDLNNDGEADLVRPFSRLAFPGNHLQDLSRDAKGNFYASHIDGIYRFSPDGSEKQVISSPSRNPLGLAVRSDGLALSDSSEGNNSNGTCTIYESEHSENLNTVSKQRRILYLPRGVDNSPGSRIFLNSSKFGPLGNSLFGVSYGTGRIYQIMRDPNNGSPQAALRLLPGEFSSGAARIKMNPKDQQLYIIGFDGWGDFGVTEGSFSRLRYTGKDSLVPLSWKSYSNGISVKFNLPIDPSSVSPKSLFLQQWNYIDSASSYGSPEYSVKDGTKMGHDRITVENITFSSDATEIFINTPNILPAMCTQIFGNLKSTSGINLKLDLYATINHLPEEAMKGIVSPPDKSRNLTVPTKKNNGNTYANIIEFFNKRAGKDSVKRGVGPVVAYQKKDLNFNWIQTNIIEKQSCLGCHNSDSKYDFTNYNVMLKSINLKNPAKSHILGMMASESMPTFPMPTVDPKMQKAFKEWIEMGAPK